MQLLVAGGSLGRRDRRGGDLAPVTVVARPHERELDGAVVRERGAPRGARAVGSVAFNDPHGETRPRTPLTVVEVDEPRRFAYRWEHDGARDPGPANCSSSSNSTTSVSARVTESGFTRRGFPGGDRAHPRRPREGLERGARATCRRQRGRSERRHRPGVVGALWGQPSVSPRRAPGEWGRVGERPRPHGADLAPGRRPAPGRPRRRTGAAARGPSGRDAGGPARRAAPREWARG